MKSAMLRVFVLLLVLAGAAAALGWQWRLLMRLQPAVYRAGEYRLDAGLLPADLLNLLASGRVIQHRFTLVEGWSFRQLAAALIENPVLVHELDFDSPDRLARVGALFGLEHPEGWFLPETYQFARGSSDRDILERSHAAMRQELDRAWSTRSAELPLQNPYRMDSRDAVLVP